MTWNLRYHETAASANPFVSLLVTFCTAALISGLLFPLWPASGSLAAELPKLNWASAAIGITIVGVDAGYLLLYRSGWNVSLGSVFCNAWVALLLIPLGVVLFKEKLATSNIVGVALAVAGIYLIARQ